ncbi:hypothetical protein RYH80_13340 [Halobaculum sp. MBLA0147]|uniref:hypothetical protein n=1 Tax=Halobaculum sp. MBLA0147 TaxID=3079934 RepID=UPI003523358D
MTNSESTSERVTETEVTGERVTETEVTGERVASEETSREETTRGSPDPDERVATLARLRRVQAAAVDHALTADAARAAFRFVGAVERLRAARAEWTHTGVGGETPVPDEISSSTAQETTPESWQRDLLAVGLAAVGGARSSSVADTSAEGVGLDETSVSSERGSTPGEESHGSTDDHPGASSGETAPSLADWHSRPDAASLGAAVAHVRFDASLTRVAAAVDRRPETVARLAARIARRDSLPTATASSTESEDRGETTDERDRDVSCVE